MAIVVLCLSFIFSNLILLIGHKELTSKLAALPIRSDTMRVRNAKEQLEAKLCEVEEAVKIFSRPKVYVKCED